MKATPTAIRAAASSDGRTGTKRCPSFPPEGFAFDVGAVARDHGEVQDHGPHEHPKHEKVEACVRRLDSGCVLNLVEGDPAEERECDKREQIVEEVVEGDTTTAPAHTDCDRAHQRCGRAVKERHREHQRQETSGDLESRRSFNRGEMADQREDEQHAEQAHVPVAVRRLPDGNRDDHDQRGNLQTDHEPGWAVFAHSLDLRIYGGLNLFLGRIAGFLHPSPRKMRQMSLIA